METIGILKDVVTVDELVAYLQRKGSNRHVYTHYTTLGGLQNILNSKRWFLSRGDNASMNDQHEWMYTGSQLHWAKTYILCFSASSKENMAMWGLYGIPATQAISIRIPRKAILQWLDSIKTVEGVRFVDGKPSYTKLAKPNSLVMHDVAYTSEDNIRLRNERIPHKQVHDFRLNHEQLTGYIKDVAWEYEYEVRLQASYLDDMKYTHVALPVTDELISSFEVMCGPNFTEEKQLVKLLQTHQIEKPITYSKFTDLLRYRSLCDLCAYEYKQKSL